jgi:RimJ/RimL family protein N-acetyltransferase
MCGLIKRDYLPQPDIGFAFLPAFTGKGYAFEAATATIAYAKEILHLPTILAITLPTNLKSIHLLNKIGLQFSNMVTEPGAQGELMLFSN